MEFRVTFYENLGNTHRKVGEWKKKNSVPKFLGFIRNKQDR